MTAAIQIKLLGRHDGPFAPYRVTNEQGDILGDIEPGDWPSIVCPGQEPHSWIVNLAPGTDQGDYMPQSYPTIDAAADALAGHHGPGRDADPQTNREGDEMTTTFAVKGTARTAEGDAVKTYTSKGGTKAEALTLLAELQTVQRDGNLRKDAAIVTLDEDGNVVEAVPTALHIEGAPSLKGGILAAAFAASSPKPSHFLTALADLDARPAA